MKQLKVQIVSMLCMLLCLASLAQAQTAPVIREAKVVTSGLIELDWQGQQYINNAGRSKENTSAVHNNFEVMLNGTRLSLNSSIPSWYWNITNYQLHGVRVNQNKTTLRLATNLTNAQITALQNGTSTMTVRITGNVTGSLINVASTPAGAIAASAIGAPGPVANTTTTYPVIYKPYYDKTVTSRAGVPVRGSEFVLQRTVQQAADMVDVILSAMPENVLVNMRSRNQFVIFGQGEHSYNIPEHRSIFLSDNWNRAEGYGGNTAATSAANVERHHNIPAAQRPYESGYASGYRNESILAHEFGHGVHSAMNYSATATALRNELQSIYNSARATPENPANPTGRRKWDNSYAGSNASEYIATATATWFDAMNETASWGGTYGPLNYREELRRYDPPFYNFLTRIYPETKTLSAAWGSGIPNNSAPVYTPENTPNTPYTPNAPEPTGRFGPSVKIKSTIATNPAGSGLNAYATFGSSISTSTAVELWWDVNTDLMRWHLQPDAAEDYFRIQKKGSDLVLMPTGSGTTAGTRIVLAAVSNSNESQWWSFNRQANESFTITNKANPQMALALDNNATASGTRIVLSALTASSRFWNVEGNIQIPDRGSITNIPAQIATGSIRARAVAGNIVLENVPQGAKVEVYNLRGELVSGKWLVASGGMQIKVQAKGMYVVKVGNQTMRVLVR